MPDKLLSPEYGLSNTRLQECNASPSDVRSGKTFYSGDKNKKTGTVVEYGDITDVVSVVRAIDPDLGDRAFIRIQPGMYTTNASSGYPEVSIPFYDMIAQLGVDKGQAQYTEGTGSGNDGGRDYFALNCIPEGYYRKSGADWAPEIRIWKDVLNSKMSPTIKYAGRIWANSYANGSGHNETDFGANNQYCTGEKGTYDARIRAKVSGQFAVYIQRNNSGAEFISRWFNAGEELAWVGPSTYGNAQAYYVSL